MRLIFMCSVMVALSMAAVGQEPAKPPEGWKEYVGKDGSFAVFVPDEKLKKSERDRTSTRSGAKTRMTHFQFEGATLKGTADMVAGPVPKGSKPAKRLEEARDELVKELRAEVT
jgi:hypothetical protein